jgi:geranylgeranyl reductase family protein
VASISHDVVVVGAGPAGSATAARLAAGGWDVVLLDRARFPRPKPCAEYLSPGGVAALRRLGVFEHLDERAGRALRGMELRAPNGSRSLLEYRDGASARAGLAVPRETLDAALVDLAQAHGVQVVEQVQVTDLQLAHGTTLGVVGRGEGGRGMAYRARLVVGADGAHSRVSSRLGLRTTRSWPRRLGLVAHLDDVHWPEDHGEMHVGRRGYVGVAPLGDGRLSLGLVMPMPGGRLGVPRAALCAALLEYPELAARLGVRRDQEVHGLGEVRGVGPLAHAVRASAGPGFALVGDAAGFLDPFTGEGVFRALRGAEILAPIVDAALAGRADVVDIQAEYERARRDAFRAKERLTTLIQVFVHVPSLMNLAIDRLRRRPRLGARLGRVLGDLEPADRILRPGFLAGLLRP